MDGVGSVVRAAICIDAASGTGLTFRISTECYTLWCVP